MIPDWSELLSLAVRTALRTGDSAAVSRRLDELRRSAERFPGPVSMGFLADAEGAIAFAQGRAAEAVDARRRSAAAWTELGWDWYRGRALRDLAEALRRAGDADAAERTEDEARRMFRAMGAPAEVEGKASSRRAERSVAAD
jgi:hypothetical protein